ncbi:MAG: hypothetical protein AAB911_00805 [Patescibacteria group bacterium]
MSKDMFGIAVRKLVTLPAQALGIVCDLLEKLSDPEWIEATKKFLRKENPWELESPLGSLLEFLGAITVPATTERFVAKDKFKEDTSRKAEVKIYGTGSNFDNWFLGKIEGPIPESTLQSHRLCQPSVDGPILAELGGETKAETTLTEVHALMAKQPKGEDGVLLTNGWANIFYVKDVNGLLRAVGAFCFAGYGGWYVFARSVESPHVWYADGRVFSRSSSAT